MPNKNLAPVGGRPLLCWTIAAALQSRRITRVVVSTDSEAIAQVALAAGAEVPFLRPAALAADDTPGIAPILHAVHWLGDHERYYPDAVACLQPTSPLRTAQDVDAAVALAERVGADAVVSGVAAAHHPFWMKQLEPDGRVRPFLPDTAPVTRRQELPPVYALNGAIYLARRRVLVEQETWYTDRTFMYVMPEDRSLDLDTPWGVHLADLLLTSRQSDETV